MNALSWSERSHRHLVASIERTRARLVGATVPDAEPSLAEEPTALQIIQQRFGLTDFERDVLLLAAGPQLDVGFSNTLAEVTPEGTPTFSLALATLPGAHWTALTPNAPLRRWGLLRLPTGGVVTAPLSIDEQILHAMMGLFELGEQTRSVLRPLTLVGRPTTKPEQLEQLCSSWTSSGTAIVQAHGTDAHAKRHLAARAAQALGLDGLHLHVDDLPEHQADRRAFAEGVSRDCRLLGAALLLEAGELDAAGKARAASFLRGLDAPVLLAAREPLPLQGISTLHLEVDRPDADVRHALWTDLLPEHDPHHVEKVAAQFSLSAADIEVVAAANGNVEPERLWGACRRQARPAMDDLAQRIRSDATWSDLILPPSETTRLRELAAQVRNKYTVYQRWGMGRGSNRGLGINAIFSGPSGTGKTLAAEVLANDLALDCYRVDLSTLVSKYIGETEANLRRVFDAAESGGAVLLFDEADGLFSKRSDVKDSRDRYANIEVGYLLQRMEAYTGLAILTTNLRENVDEAFLRRIRFSIRFPFPGTQERRQIWAGAFPTDVPTDSLDLDRLAQLKVAGGSIRSIAMNAAFLAAADRGVLGMAHLERAARAEYGKLGRSMSPTEVAGWR